MCGIVGAVSNRNIVPILIEGLKRLEYRGYDSAGVSTVNHGALLVTKRAGRLDNLVQALHAAERSGVLEAQAVRLQVRGGCRGMGRRRKNRQKARGGTILQRNEKDQEDGKKEEAEEQDCTAKRKLKRRTVQQQRREAGKVR